MLIAGDIGGTKTILRLLEITTDQPFPFNLIPFYEQTYFSQSYTDLVPLIHQFLQEAQREIQPKITVEKACFGIAGPVINNTSNLTNLNWSLSGEHIAQVLSLEKVSLINDFAAIGYGILGLKPEDLCPLQTVDPNPLAPIAIIGAGTGLGEGFLIPHNGSYQVFSTEGGHTDFAPRSPLEFDLLTYIRDKFKLTRVSVERVISGIGIVSIYQFLRHKNPTLESEEMTQIYQQWDQEIGETEKNIDLASEIAKAANQKQDYLSQQTLQLFVELYGAEAGNLALKLLPYGGLYIAGGIAAKNLELMQSGLFMNGFCAKGRMEKLMKQIPIFIIKNQKVGLIGAGIHASQ